MARFLIQPRLDSDFTPTLRLPVSEIDGINVHSNVKWRQLSTHHREHCFNHFITGTYVVEGVLFVLKLLPIVFFILSKSKMSSFFLEFNFAA